MLGVREEFLEGSADTGVTAKKVLSVASGQREGTQ